MLKHKPRAFGITSQLFIVKAELPNCMPLLSKRGYLLKQCCKMSAERKDGHSFRSASTRYKKKWTVEVLIEGQYYRAQKGQASDEVDVLTHLLK